MKNSLVWLLVGCLGACGSDDDASDGSGEGSGTAADSGAETGVDTGADTGTDDHNCGMHVLESMDEDCEGIGSPMDIFGPAMTEHGEELRWAEVSGEDITHEPATGTTQVTLQLSHDGGELRCFHYCNPCPGLPCGAPDQPPRIEGDLVLDVSTDDGVLAETIDVVANGGEFGPRTDATGALAPGELQGTLTVELLNPDFADLAVSVSAQFDDGATYGSVQAVAMHTDPNGPGIVVPIARWPNPEGG